MDSSCSNYPSGTSGTDYTSVLQTAFDDALGVFEAAQDSLKFALSKRPDEKTNRDDHLKWVRIAEGIAATLGFVPDREKEESASDAYWAEIFDVVDRAVSALPANKNIPPKGYNPALWDLDNPKPMIVCGEKTWKWLALTDTIPGTTRILKDEPGLEKDANKGAQGAWFLNHRLIFRKRRGFWPTPRLCQPGEGALTYPEFDMILICDWRFTAGNLKLDSMGEIKTKGKIAEQALITDYIEQLSGIMVHELLHFYSARDDSKPKDSFMPKIIDQWAVNDLGRVLYYDQMYGGPRPLDDSKVEAYAKKPDAKLISTYGVRYVWNLAVTRKFAKYSGPRRALTCADSIAHFCDMMFYSHWNWATQGMARVPGKDYGTKAAKRLRRWVSW